MKGSRFAHLAWVISAVAAVVCLLTCAYIYWGVSSSAFREAGDLLPVWILLGVGVWLLVVTAFLRVLEGVAGSLEELVSKSGEGQS